MKRVKNILEFKRSDLEPTGSFVINDTLNPDVWNDFQIKVEVREKLLDIANEFINTIHGDFTIYDIVLIGSLAGYNWSKYSDFDIHIVVDYTDINDDFELVEEYVDLLSKKWNKNYEILIHDYDVELYIEDKNVSRDHINGLYSLLKDKWTLRPKSNDDQVVDTKLIERKAVSLMEQIDAIDVKSSRVSYNVLKDESDKIWDKIKKSRRDGINSPDGEYAVGNLVFKYLRRNGYIGKIIDIKKKLVEAKFSL
jgi:predicted nucleotidyltransferase